MERNNDLTNNRMVFLCCYRISSPGPGHAVTDVRPGITVLGVNQVRTEFVRARHTLKYFDSPPRPLAAFEHILFRNEIAFKNSSPVLSGC